MGSGPACPYLRKLSSKALLYRCAVSRAGPVRDVTGGVTAVADRGLPGAVMRWSAYVVGAGGVDLRLLSCQIHRGFRHWNSRPLGIVRNRAETVGQRRCRHGAWLMIRDGSLRPYRSLRTAFAARLLPLVDP